MENKNTNKVNQQITTKRLIFKHSKTTICNHKLEEQQTINWKRHIESRNYIQKNRSIRNVLTENEKLKTQANCSNQTQIFVF